MLARHVTVHMFAALLLVATAQEHAQAQAAPSEVDAAETAAPPTAPAPVALPPLAATPDVEPNGAGLSKKDEPVLRAEPRSALPGPVAAPASEALPAFLDWVRYVKLGGGAILYYYQPLKKGWDNNLSFFHVRADIDVNVEAFGIHLEPRFRDSKLRSFYDGPVWIEEAYASWTFGPFAALKVGKTYSRLGLFWDNSFYGNVQVYDGLKLAPDYGASLEGSIGDRIGVNYWAQFFLVDGRTNVSLANRDTVSVPGARRRNEVVVNIEPFLKFGEDGLLKVGVSGQRLDADIPGDKHSVLRLAAHAKLTVDGLGVWGELLHQQGRHVNGYPFVGTAAMGDTAAVPGRASGDNTYFEIGAEYTLGSFAVRYNVSHVTYADVHVDEWMHVPAVSYKVAKPITVLAELVFWRSHAAAGNSDVDKSLNVTVLANF